ncbi:hypothetical protein D3C72_2379750 [compost metagenome]
MLATRCLTRWNPVSDTRERLLLFAPVPPGCQTPARPADLHRCLIALVSDTLDTPSQAEGHLPRVSDTEKCFASL